MIVCILKSLNSGKSNVPDDISARMLLLCDYDIVLPLRLIFTNILSTGIWTCFFLSGRIWPFLPSLLKLPINS